MIRLTKEEIETAILVLDETPIEMIPRFKTKLTQLVHVLAEAEAEGYDLNEIPLMEKYLEDAGFMIEQTR